MLRVVRRIPGDLDGVHRVSVTLVCNGNMDEMGWVEAEWKEQKKGGWV